jgi:hypothetical protein
MNLSFPKQTKTETYHVPVEEYNARDEQGGTEFEDLNICVLTGWQ